MDPVTVTLEPTLVPRRLGCLPSLEAVLRDRPHAVTTGAVGFRYSSTTGLNLELVLYYRTARLQTLPLGSHTLRFLSYCCGEGVVEAWAMKHWRQGESEEPYADAPVCFACGSLQPEELVLIDSLTHLELKEEKGLTAVAAALEATVGLNSLEALIAAEDTIEDLQSRVREFCRPGWSEPWELIAAYSG